MNLPGKILPGTLHRVEAHVSMRQAGAINPALPRRFILGTRATVRRHDAATKQRTTDWQRKMALKLAISGKGGVGKSTLAAMFAHLAVADGHRVLAIDADPDANLAAALGMPEHDRRKLVPLVERTALIEQRTGAKVKQYGQVFKLNPDVSDIAEQESGCFRGIHILVLGAIERAGSGCACPESVLLRSLLMDVVLYKDDFVILDLEAGLEHLGRATAQGIDLMLVVVEPGRRAVETADTIRTMAAELGIKRCAVVGNKVTCDRDSLFLEEALAGYEYLGSLPFSETIRRADRDGLVLTDTADEELAARFRTLWEKIGQCSR
ncbi:MAG: AAA family ATPase [Phycisphaerae bacterium]